jgi:site-specific recombinase XerD
VLHIPSKKKAKRAICYLEPEEVAAILAQPDKETLLGQRDHTLLGFLYNTGARIQEALDVCPKHLRLDSPAHVRLFGKGRKERICPLWPETAALIAALLRRQPRTPDEPIFCNRYGRNLGASGVRFQLHQYITSASQTVPSLSAKRISPHTFRHTTAVHLIASGVDVTVIRSWLGHAQLDTTNHYAQANLQTKREALERVAPRARPSKPPRWKNDQNLLAWLDSL